jgi:microcystin-dependent protein
MALPVRKAYKGAPVTTTLSALLSAGGTSCTVASVAGWPTTFPFYIVIEPGTSREEKVRVTGATGTTLTIARNQDDTSDVEHASASTVYVVFTAVEADEANQIASAMTTKGDLITTDGSTINRLAVGGTNTHVLQVDSAQTNGIKWGQVATAGIADDAVTPAKLSFDIAGVITAFGGASAPTGWLLCDGSAVSRSTYADLFTVVGVTYGVGDGTTTFNVPNLKGRIPVGLDSTQTEFDTLAETGGAKTVTLSTSEIPSHLHTITHDHGTHSHSASIIIDNAGSHNHTITTTSGSLLAASGTAAVAITNEFSNTTGSAGTHTHTATVTVNNSSAITFTGNSGSTGGGGAHNNLQPYIVVNYIIKH